MTRKSPPFRRGGRPRKADLQKRRLLIAAHMRPDELAAIEGRAAAINSPPVGLYPHAEALSGAIRVRQSRQLSAIDRHDLARIGSNLNQIARACKAKGETLRACAIGAFLESCVDCSGGSTRRAGRR